MKNYDEQYEDIFVNAPVYTDWVSTNKTDGGQETIIYRVLEPGTGREIASDLEPDEANIIENSRELYEAVGDMFKKDVDLGDAINKLQRIYETI